MAAQNGDTVKVHYTGQLQDGSVFDTSREREPLTVTLGSQQLIGGFEREVQGMEPGESKTFVIPADDAYGPRDDRLIDDVPREQLPPDLDLTPGARLAATTQDGQQVALTVVEANDESVKLDANHPLAGEDLTFQIELVEIV